MPDMAQWEYARLDALLGYQVESGEWTFNKPEAKRPARSVWAIRTAEKCTKVGTAKVRDIDAIQALDALGREGWIASPVDGGSYYFLKREIGSSDH